MSPPPTSLPSQIKGGAPCATQLAMQTCMHTCRVLARPFPKGTVPYGGSNVPFESAPKPTMCPLAPPQNQHIFNSHLNYLNLKTVWVQTTELSEH